MLFNSFQFLVFLPIVFFLYWFVFNVSKKWQDLLILCASYFFYGSWSFKFMGLLLLSTVLDFIYGFSVASSNKTKAKFFLWLSVINNLGILFVFKYYNFFIEQFAAVLETAGINPSISALNIVLPIGISFYTFHGMSYIFDIYRGIQKPIKNFTEYAVFVSFFPLLVAGPIERASHLLPQIQRPRFFDYTQAKGGAKLILWGMCKKILVADSLSKIVENSFSNYQELSSISLIVGAVAFSFQIYCDFSGYSDIAIGTAKLFGFELLSNFKFPYFSRNIAEFWRRWHISLSSWFKDYLYIPLGGSKKGILFTIRNVFLVFVISGFWHGANWKFIIWGTIHACGFLPLLLLNKNRQHLDSVVAAHSRLPSFKELGSMVLTFLFVTCAWIFFRADDISHAFSYLHATASNFGSVKTLMDDTLNESLLYLIPFLVLDWHFRRNDRDIHLPINNSVLRTLIYMLIVLLLFYHLLLTENSSFIYFQF